MSEANPLAHRVVNDPFSNPVVTGPSSQEFLDLATTEIDASEYGGTFYEEVGGRPVFAELTRRFYASVAQDEDFRTMYPEQDLHPAQIRLQLFLEQYWGGPKTYSEHRGHPRLRMRHMPFHVNAHYRDVWLGHMNSAIDQLGLPPLHAETLRDYFDRAAHSLVNRAD